MEDRALSREEIALRILVGLVSSSQRSLDQLCPIDTSPASNPDRIVKTKWIIESAFHMADVFAEVRDEAPRVLASKTRDEA